MEKYKDIFCRSEEEKEIFSNLKTTPMEELFHSYEGDDVEMVGSDHWSVAVANIIYRETGIRVNSWVGSASDVYQNRPSIMLIEMQPWYLNEIERKLTQNSLIQILDKYVVDLGCQVTDCYYLINSEDDDDPFFGEF